MRRRSKKKRRGGARRGDGGLSPEFQYPPSWEAPALSSQRTLCAGSLRYQLQSDVITAGIHLSKQYQPGVGSSSLRLLLLLLLPAAAVLFFPQRSLELEAADSSQVHGHVLNMN